MLGRREDVIDRSLTRLLFIQSQLGGLNGKTTDRHLTNTDRLEVASIARINSLPPEPTVYYCLLCQEWCNQLTLEEKV